MPNQLRRILVSTACSPSATVTPAYGRPPSEGAVKTAVGFLNIDTDISVRRMVTRSANPKGVVLLLHGFPETLYAWEDVVRPLAEDYEVHAFDWPGYGQTSRPGVDKFGYTPKDHARILKEYIRKARIDRSRLTIYATDIGALPALLLALEDPGIARRIIVGDFAPFDRPQYMYPSLQSLKLPASSAQARHYLNSNRDEILASTFTRGLAKEQSFEISKAFREDASRGWDFGGMTSADAFYHYYSRFTRDQNHLEEHLERLRTPVKVIWGEKDLYTSKDMGIEFANQISAEIAVLPGVGHYPHLQKPELVVEEVRASFR